MEYQHKLEEDSESEDKASLKKSKKSLVVLLTLIIILIVALGGLGYYGFSLFMEATSATKVTVKPPNQIPDDQIDDVVAPKTIEYAKTEIPDLTGLFMLDLLEVQEKLGNSFQLIKTDAVEDSSNKDIKQLAIFSYKPEILNGSENDISTALLPSETIYASLNEDGKIIDIYYVCDVRLLDYPEKSFIELLDTDWLVRDVLNTAGVNPLDFTYDSPVFDSSVVYDNPNSENRKIIKQTVIFSGRIVTERIPTVWTLTVTYDFGSGTETPDDLERAIRTINLKLA